VPSGWTGPSHLLITSPPYWQPALAGGAAAVVNVDLSPRALAWAKENAALNGVLTEDKKGDVFHWLRRFRRLRRSFSLVVLDPPAFARGPSGPFSIAKETPGLVAEAAAVVEEGGLLIACCNQQSLPRQRFLALVQKGLRRAGRSGHSVAHLGASPVDFPPAEGQAEGLKVEVLRLEGSRLASVQ